MVRPTKKSAMWEGVEVESTQFKGLMTLFVCRDWALHRALQSEHPHVLIAIADPQFWNATISAMHLQTRMLNALREFIIDMINDGKRVTVEMDAMQECARAIIASLTDLRVSPYFLLYVSVMIPNPEDEGYAIKVYPVDPFDEVAGGVYVATPQVFEHTPAADYANDRDVE